MKQLAPFRFLRLLAVCVTTALCLCAQLPVAAAADRSHPVAVSFADLAEKIRPAVVNVSTTSTVKVPDSHFRFFFGLPDEEGPGENFRRDQPDREMKQSSLGSGFIFDREGYIITNNHMIEKAQEIKVRFSDGRELTAKVVGRDSKTDLALIKIPVPEKGELPVLPLGDSARMRVGDWVLAVGNPFGLEHTVTQGIISATGRVIGAGPYDDFLQTDAAINPGNSGGPLVNLNGEVIGINSVIVSGGQGLGFAIPSNTAKAVISQLKEKGKVVRGWLGVTIQQVTPDIAPSFGLKEPSGALVTDVNPGSPAEAAGIRRGDVITAFDGKKVKTSSDLPRMVAGTAVGKEVPVGLVRDAKDVTVKVKIAELTDERGGAPQEEPAGSSFGMKLDDVGGDMPKALGIMDTEGVLVVAVERGSAADEAGIQAGDVIKEVDRKPVRNLREYQKAVEQRDKALFLVKRGKQSLYVTVGAY